MRTRRAVQKVEATEIWTNLGIFFGGIMAAVAAYYGKKVPPPPSTSPVLAGVGLEFGSRDQMERMIDELARIAGALESLADHRQSDMKDTMDELLDRLRSAERKS